VISVLPVFLAFPQHAYDSSDAGTGTFAEQDSSLTGDVTIICRRQCDRTLRRGQRTGTIYAGVQMTRMATRSRMPVAIYVLNPVYTGTDPASTGNAGTANSKLALSLISGGWTVDAANISFCRKSAPNGFFNNVGRRYRARLS